jgi:hypothetical protein
MTVLENSLREMFERQVESSLTVDDPATVAIRRARRVRHRRSVVHGIATVLVIVGLAVGTVQLQHWWQGPVATTGVVSPILPRPEPVHEPVPEPWHGGELGVELRMFNRLWTATGEHQVLSGSALVRQAYRTPYGVVYGSEQEIRLRRDDATVVDLVSYAGQWLVSPDGRQVVSVAGDTAQVVPLDMNAERGQLEQAHVPEGTRPAAFWGSRVILGSSDGARFDVWDPAGSYDPAWNSALAAVYGPVDEDLLVLVGEPGGYCLALVPAGADRLEPDQTDGSCQQPLPVTADGYGWLAPGGGWLAVPDGDQVQLIQVTLDEREVTPVATCPRHEPVTPIWSNPTTLLSADGDGAVSCDIDGAVNRSGRPDRIGRLWQYVPALGVDR